MKLTLRHTTLRWHLPPVAAAADHADSDLVMDMHPDARTTGATGNWTLEEDAELTSAVANAWKTKWAIRSAR
jgi:hypothetical protein